MNLFHMVPDVSSCCSVDSISRAKQILTSMPGRARGAYGHSHVIVGEDHGEDSWIIGDKGIFSLKVPLFHITQAGKYEDLLQAGPGLNAPRTTSTEATLPVYI